MKKIFYLIGMSALFLASSCNSDEVLQPTSDVKLYTPAIQGSIGQFTDDIHTRTGVIEDNDDAGINGEQFYWIDGDKVKMLFYEDGILDSTPTVLTYTAVVEDGVKSKTCEFITDETIPEGNYTVYGLYPADGWSQDNVTGEWKVAMRSADITMGYLPVEDMSSKHLGRYMYMKSDAVENVTIGEDESNSINLSYRHLTSVIRIKITNPNTDIDARLFRLSMGVNLGTGIPELGFESYFYPVEATLVGGIATTSLAPETAINVARIQIPDDITDLNMLDFDLFIPVLPTGEPLESNTFTFVGSVYLDGSTSPIRLNPLYKTIGATDLPNGFEAGKSYIFNLEVPLLGD